MLGRVCEGETQTNTHTDFLCVACGRLDYRLQGHAGLHCFVLPFVCSCLLAGHGGANRQTDTHTDKQTLPSGLFCCPGRSFAVQLYLVWEMEMACFLFRYFTELCFLLLLLLLLYSDWVTLLVSTFVYWCAAVNCFFACRVFQMIYVEHFCLFLGLVWLFRF